MKHNIHELNRKSGYLYSQDRVLEVRRETKRKPAQVTIAIPDWLAKKLIRMSLCADGFPSIMRFALSWLENTSDELHITCPYEDDKVVIMETGTAWKKLTLDAAAAQPVTVYKVKQGEEPVSTGALRKDMEQALADGYSLCLLIGMIDKENVRKRILEILKPEH